MNQRILFFIACGILSSQYLSCTNSPNLNSVKNLTPQTSSTTTTSTTTTTQDTEYITSVTLTQSSNGNLTTTLYLNSTQSTAPISSHCTPVTTANANTTKPCNCEFSWPETIGGTGNDPSTGLPNLGTSITHTVQTPISTVQAYSVVCTPPSLYSSEIPVGTSINISITAGASNPDASLFQSNDYPFVKPTSSASSNYNNQIGQGFQNITRYSCYSVFQRGMSIQSKRYQATNSTSNAIANMYYATQFCVAPTSGTSDPTSCPNIGNPGWSSQNYYYDLYVPSQNVGTINQSNNYFQCPTVNEHLNAVANYWPLDSTFSLMQQGSQTFSVGVVANSIISATGDTASTNTTCPVVGATPTAAATVNQAAAPAMIQSCLGYAATVNADGSCPTFINQFNQVQLTYRLRRYVAIYPSVYDTNGTPLTAQMMNTIYVLDRPINSQNMNPLKPFTILGPKPCPFAFFDQKGVTTDSSNPNANYPTGSSNFWPCYQSPKTPACYAGSNNPGWINRNVDGISFPNTDNPENGVGVASCSAAFPIMNSNNQFSIMTLNANNSLWNPNSLTHQYVRPITPFLPHYEEDTTFQACAPQSSQFQDPPLHFVQDPSTGQVAWCAESYPTQNTLLSNLDPQASGLVPNYTSHTVKNSTSTACSASTISITNYASSPYPAYQAATIPAYATHSASLSWDSSTANQTCDRTVIAQNALSAGSAQSAAIPLLASAFEIENASYGIQIDSSYFCAVSYDNSGAKTMLPTGTTGIQAIANTPTSGCCSPSVVSLPTVSGTSLPKNPVGAHLEPGTPCGIPNY